MDPGGTVIKIDSFIEGRAKGYLSRADEFLISVFSLLFESGFSSASRNFVPQLYKNTILLSRRPGLNRRPRPYQGRALPTELRRHVTHRLLFDGIEENITEFPVVKIHRE